MSSSATRLLLLGGVIIFEPVNGYQLRRELLSWRVDEWAHINPGSIYSGLATLARQSHLDRHELPEGGRRVTVYTITAAGRGEFARLFEDAVITIDQSSFLGLYAALSQLPLVARAEALRLLGIRLAALDSLVAEAAAAEAAVGHPSVPPHLPIIQRLWQGLAATERAWLVDTIRRVEQGEAIFADDPGKWTPPPDDPGWELAADRERYRAALGLD